MRNNRTMLTKALYRALGECTIPCWAWLLQCTHPLQLSEVFSKHLEALLEEVINAVPLPHHHSPPVPGAVPVAVGDAHLLTWRGGRGGQGRGGSWGQEESGMEGRGGSRFEFLVPIAHWTRQSIT